MQSLAKPECRVSSAGGVDSWIRVCDLTQPSVASLASNNDMTSPWMMTDEEAIMADVAKAVSDAKFPAEPLVIEDRSIGIVPGIFDGEYEGASGKFPSRAGRRMHD
jgi:hypothetical protein